MIRRAAAVALITSLSGLALAVMARLKAGLPPLWIEGFGALALVALVLLTGGTLVRDRSPRVALAAWGFGLFITLSIAMTTLNASMLPLQVPRIDTALMAMDAALGLDWVGFVHRLDDWPGAAAVLRAVYGSHLIQLSVMILALAYRAEADRLAQMAVTATLCATMTLAIW